MGRLVAFVAALLCSFPTLAFRPRPVSDLGVTGGESQDTVGRYVATDGVDFLVVGVRGGVAVQMIVRGRPAGALQLLANGEPRGAAWTGASYLVA